MARAVVRKGEVGLARFLARNRVRSIASDADDIAQSGLFDREMLRSPPADPVLVQIDDGNVDFRIAVGQYRSGGTTFVWAPVSAENTLITH